MSKKIMILVLTMTLTLGSTAFAHADQPNGEMVVSVAAVEAGSGRTDSVNGTGGTNSAEGTDAANGTESTRPADSGENGQTVGTTADSVPAREESKLTDGESTDAADAAQTETDKPAAEGTQKDTKDTKVNSKDKKVAETKPVSKYQKGLAAYIRGKNKNLSKEWSIKLAGYFIKSGKKNKIDPKVLMALAQRESNFRAKARSKYGYKGMMQCTSSFAKAYGYKASELYQADVSIEIAARYLRTMKNRHESYRKAIACYVCGSGAVAKGVHSREPGRSVMKTRDKIQRFLTEKNYV